MRAKQRKPKITVFVALSAMLILMVSGCSSSIKMDNKIDYCYTTFIPVYSGSTIINVPINNCIDKSSKGESNGR
jgi:hypothetical protein